MNNDQAQRLGAKEQEPLGTYYIDLFCSTMSGDDFSLTDPIGEGEVHRIPARAAAWHEVFHSLQNAATGLGMAHALYRRA